MPSVPMLAAAPFGKIDIASAIDKREFQIASAGAFAGHTNGCLAARDDTGLAR